MSEERSDLDALLDAEDGEALACAVQADPELERALALQEAIDASLRRAFVPPDLDALHQRLEEAVEVGAVMVPAVVPARAHAPRRPSWLSHPVVALVAAMAAMVLLVLLGVQALGSRPAGGPGDPSELVVRVEDERPAPSTGPPTVASRWADLYRGLPPEGFGPPEPLVFGDAPDGASCASDGSSALVVRPTFGLTVRSECSGEPPCARWGLEASRVVELVVDPQGLRVLVFVYPASVDPRPSLWAGSRLHLFRRQLGHLVLYELSPLGHAVGLDAFTL
ncbi:MAG: hypothetical protein AAGF11_03820 [Myxococcota bacterium]